MKKIIEDLNVEKLKYGEEKELYHRNCAEILLIGANKKYDLGVEPKYVKLISPFGGGMWSGYTCGALAGAVSAIGMKYLEDLPSTNDEAKAIIKEYVKRFNEHFGSTECKYIKRDFAATGCNPVKVQAGEILEQLLSEIDNKNK